MPQFYPHKQTAIIFIVCILAVLGVLWYVWGGNIRKQGGVADMSNQQNVQLTQPNSVFATTTDWQKQFFGHSTSTALKNAASVSADKTPDEPETVTGQFGKKFFEQYMLLKQNNLTDDPTAVQAVIDQNTNDIVSSAPQARVYDIRSISLTTTDDMVVARTYANTVVGILSSYGPAGDIAKIATEAFDQNDPTRIKEIDSIANSYSTVLKKLLEVPAPKSISENHLSLVNAVSSMVFVSQGMSKVFADPLQSMVALAVYEKSYTSLFDALLDLKYTFSQKQIQFSNSESGNIFNLIN